MIRITDGLLIVAAVAGAVWTYQIKHEAELSARKLSSLRAGIASQNNKIALLQADWALMTSPGRLEELAERFSKQLQLQRLDSNQIVTPAELPAFSSPPEPPQQMRAQNDGVDGITTGGIGDLIKQNDGEIQ